MLSIIIPTYNEEKCLGICIKAILENCAGVNHEIIVVDGGSCDNTLSIARQLGANVFQSNVLCRAVQMNIGAKNAKGTQLLFLHSDVTVPVGYANAISDVLDQTDFGFFAYDFKSNRRLLKLMTIPNARKGRFTGGGDQGLFIRPESFNAIGGFDENMAIMEDFDLKDRALKKGFNYQIISKIKLKVSARKYENNSFLRVWIANTIAFIMYMIKTDSRRIAKFYTGMLR